MAPLTGVASQLGLEQLHFAQYAVYHFNKALHIHVHYTENDSQLPVVAVAVQRADSIVASNAVAVVGPAGSNEVEAVGPIFKAHGIGAVSGSATKTTLTTSGANPTFLRVVAPDAVQGPQDAHYIISHLHPHHIVIIDDEEAYSQGLVTVMTPIFQSAGVSFDHQSYNGADSGPTLANDLAALVTAHVHSGDVVVIPWQSPANAQVLANTIAQHPALQHVTLWGTDGTDAPGTFDPPGAYVSNFGPDISTSPLALDKAIVKGVAKFGPYGSFGVPTYEATHVIMKAIANVCAAGHQPSRANVLAQIRKTYIAGNQNAFGVPIKFNMHGDIIGGGFYLFHVNANKQYIQIPAK
jgi:branched-chain amino acid transport system substrate-binding protein